jgi:hypothetical protein
VHFLTGSYPTLQAVWQAYQIQIDARRARTRT